LTQKADVEIPEQLGQVIDDAVRRSLEAELGARGLLLTRAASDSATTHAVRLGAALFRRVLAHCYRVDPQDEDAIDVEVEDDQAATRFELALAFGSATASLLSPPRRSTRTSGADSVDLLCAVFNLGIGLVDGLCDGNAQLGLALLQVLRDVGLSSAAQNPWPDGRLLTALPAPLATDPTVAFTARLIEAFFDLLHANYPGENGSPLRDHIGARVEEALEAERLSVDRSVELAGREQLIECSRRTSVVPFEIIEHIATGGRALTSPSAGTLLGEAMWRIDDLVDLAEDAGHDALNGVLLTVQEEPGTASSPDGTAALQRLLGSDVISRAAAQAAECLDAGLDAAPGATAANAYRSHFLSFVLRYAGIAPSAELHVGR
jgi:hypothetical protein